MHAAGMYFQTAYIQRGFISADGERRVGWRTCERCSVIYISQVLGAKAERGVLNEFARAGDIPEPSLAGSIVVRNTARWLHPPRFTQRRSRVTMKGAQISVQSELACRPYRGRRRQSKSPIAIIFTLGTTLLSKKLSAWSMQYNNKQINVRTDSLFVPIHIPRPTGYNCKRRPTPTKHLP